MTFNLFQQTKMKAQLKKASRHVLMALVFLLCYSSVTLYGQTRTVSGTVKDSKDEPLVGVSVFILGTSSGTTTDIDGGYTIEVPQGSDTLIFTYVGFEQQVVRITGGTINIEMEESSDELSETVVTALGIKRERKSIGYATQEVKGDQLIKAREANVVNSLAGRVAGVNITQGSSGPAGSSRIVIRGETSLSGDNQPLFVVDGIPINNQTFGAAGNNGTMGVDYGNGAADINPDDIDEISVLKGPNAAALYGSRAANGVVLITTKSGKGKKGLGVSVNSTATFEQPLRLWRYQDSYGVGSNFEFAYADGLGGGTNDFIDESWGPRTDGRLLPQFNSPTTNGYRAADTRVPNRGDIIPTPFTPNPDGIKNFYETGRTFTNNVAITGGNDLANFRLSFTNLENTGIHPNTDLQRNTVAFSGGIQPTDKLNVQISANYVNSGSNNITNHGYGTESVEYLWTWWGRDLDLDDMREYWQRGFEGTEQFNYNYNWNDNPYFTLYENTNGFNKDRLFGNIKVHYDFSDKLKLMLRTGTDLSNDLRTSRRAFSTQRFPFGMYRETRYYFNERNSDFLLTYNDEVDNRDFNFSVSFGGHRMNQETQMLLTSANQLNVPNVYNLGNTRIPLEVDQFNATRRINSFYGIGQISFRRYAYLDLTARNDWSSTLPTDNNSYFYPSATLSLVFTDMFDLAPTSKLSFAKLRLGAAQVGNDTDPYRLQNFFAYGQNWGSIQTAGEQNSIANANLKPEIVTSYEVGTDVRFYNGRLGLDFTYYFNNSENQILSIPVSRASGYHSRFINAGKIESQGIELMLTATPVKTKDFQWNVNLNWSRDRTYVRELAEGLETYQIYSQYLSVEARVDQRMGDMYGLGILRHTDGRPIYNQSGFPVRSTEQELIGNYNPDWMMGLFNNFQYKNFNLGVLVDLSWGGMVYSRTYLIKHTSGVHQGTEDREGTFIGDGVVRNEDGSFSENTTELSGRDYYWSHYNRNNHREGSFDATYAKLRELRFGYRFDDKIFGKKLPFRNVTFSVVGRNLFLWTKEVEDFDPDTFAFSGNRFAPGIEVSTMPTTRSLGFNLNFNF